MFFSLSSVFLVLSLLLLVGCASQKSDWVSVNALVPTQQDTPFTASGRLSITLNNRSQMARFSWDHHPPRDQFSVNSPLGNTLARLTKDEQGVTLQANGKTWHAASLELLMEQQLAWSLPLADLAWWIRGRTAPGEPPVVVEKGGAFKQNGWLVHFKNPSSAPPGLYPKQIELTHDGLTIRILTDQWQ